MIYLNLYLSLYQAGALDCENHRTVICMSHTTKLSLRIIFRKVRSKTKPELSDEQSEFLEEKVTNNDIYISPLY